MICFISGGVRSGKSSYAEEYVNKIVTHRKIYLATSVPYDSEMKQRVKRHQMNRKNKHWLTIEKEKNLQEIIPSLKKDDTVLLDCLTLLLSNEMFNETIALDVVDKIVDNIEVIHNSIKDLVIVSNDLFSGLNDFEDYTNEYIKNLGKLHIQIVEKADEAYECVSGIKILNKGGTCYERYNDSRNMFGCRKKLYSYCSM